MSEVHSDALGLDDSPTLPGRHRWTRPVWQDGRVCVMNNGCGDMAAWRMEGCIGDENARWWSITSEYFRGEDMGR